MSNGVHGSYVGGRWVVDLERLKSRPSAEREFFTAFHLAKGFTEDDGLMPVSNEFGEFKYQPHQGIKAACMTREDVTAISFLQLTILKKLDRNRSLILVCIALLLYIAIKLS